MKAFIYIKDSTILADDNTTIVVFQQESPAHFRARGHYYYTFRCLQNSISYQIMACERKVLCNIDSITQCAMITASRLHLPVVPASRLPDPVMIVFVILYSSFVLLC